MTDIDKIEAPYDKHDNIIFQSDISHSDISDSCQFVITN